MGRGEEERGGEGKGVEEDKGGEESGRGGEGRGSPALTG